MKMRGIITKPQDNIKELLCNEGPTNVITYISSDGYYGYQPQIHTQVNNSPSGELIRETNVRCDMEVEFGNSCDQNIQRQHNIPRQFNRKRRWEHTDVEIFKKRREQENSSINICNQPMQSVPAQTSHYLRKPTHNIPDLPRCLMGHYV